jgi:exosortase
MAYLWWERSGERPVSKPSGGAGFVWWGATLALVAAALPLRLFLTPYPLWTKALWAYLAVLAGTAALAEWRRAGFAGARWLLAPCILLVSALPWPAAFEQTVIFPLREGMAALAAEVSNAIGRPALAAGTTVRLASGWVGIDEACGGIRSLQACVMIALFFGEWFRFGLARRAALLAIGACSALAGNFGRVLFLALSASTGGDEAVTASHDAAAWVALGISLAVTSTVACRWAGWSWPQMGASSPRPATTAARTAGAWVLASAALLAVNEGAARWWFARGAEGRDRGLQWTVAFPSAHRSFVEEPLGEMAAEMLQPGTFFAGRWQESGGANVSAYYIEWRKGQAARFIPFMHNPTICLPTAGCELAGELGQIEIDWKGMNIPFRAYRFTLRSEELWVAFAVWDPSRAVPMGQPAAGEDDASWGVRWREVAERREDQPAQMLTVAVWDTKGDPAEELRRRIVELLRQP